MLSGLISGLLGPVLEKVIPDVNARKEAQEKLQHLEINGDLEQLKGQLAINLAEAKSESRFVAGWRPGVGWVCALGLLYTSLIEPFAMWAFEGLPRVNDTLLVSVLLGMLGLTGARTVEKIKGVSKIR